MTTTPTPQTLAEAFAAQTFPPGTEVGQVFFLDVTEVVELTPEDAITKGAAISVGKFAVDLRVPQHLRYSGVEDDWKVADPTAFPADLSDALPRLYKVKK